MQQIHSLCPLCNQEQFIQTICTVVTFEADLNSMDTFKVLLNPIVYLFKVTSDNNKFITNLEYIINQQHAYYIEQTTILPVQLDLLYGFDFFIQGCYLLYAKQDQDAHEHFDMFEKINILCKRKRLRNYNKFSNIYFNEVFEEYFHLVKQFNAEHSEVLNQYLTQHFLATLHLLEDTQFFAFSENSPNFTLERKDKLHQCQLHMACVLQDFSQEAIFTRVYMEFLQTLNYTDSIGGTLFKDYQRSNKLWQIYFNKITPDQKLSHIHTLVFYLDRFILNIDQPPYEQSIIFISNLMQLGRSLSKLREFWLALVIYSFFRKLSKIDQKKFNLIPYISQINCKIANISLYLGQSNGAYKLYLEQYEKNKSIKLQTKLLLLSIYLKKDEKGHSTQCESYRLSNLMAWCQGKLKHKKYEQFLAYLQQLLYSSLPSMILPKGDLLRLANVIELKDQEIPKCNQKSEIQLTLKDYFTALEFFLLLASKTETLNAQLYSKQIEHLETFLMAIDCNQYVMLSKVIESFPYQFNIQETLILCHFHQYISNFNESQRCLKIFDKNFNSQYKKHKDASKFNQIREKYWSEIFIHHDEMSRAITSLQVCHDYYNIGVLKLAMGQFKEGIEYLKYGAKENNYDLCYNHLLDILNRSRGSLSKYAFGYCYDNLENLISDINVDFLQSQCMLPARSLSRSIFIESRSSSRWVFDQDAVRRSSSVLTIYSELTDLINIITDENLIKLITLVSAEASKLPAFNMQELTQLYPNNRILHRDVTLYSNDEQTIVIKKKSIANKNVQNQLREILIEIQCQFLVNKLYHEGFAELLHLEYQIEVGKITKVEFYLIYPYYKDVKQLEVAHLQSLTESIRFLNDNKIYHRDLKPQNIRFHKNRPVIIDFDCSYYFEPTLQLWLGGNGFSPDYYPKDDEHHDKIDIYSLGIIAKQLVINCSEEFYRAATSSYNERCSLSMLLDKLNY